MKVSPEAFKTETSPLGKIVLIAKKKIALGSRTRMEPVSHPETAMGIMLTRRTSGYRDRGRGPVERQAAPNRC